MLEQSIPGKCVRTGDIGGRRRGKHERGQERADGRGDNPARSVARMREAKRKGRIRLERCACANGRALDRLESVQGNAYLHGLTPKIKYKLCVEWKQFIGKQ